MVCSQMIDLSTIVMSLDAPMLVCCHKRFKPAHRDLNNNGSKRAQQTEFATQQPEASVEETKFPIRGNHTKKSVAVPLHNLSPIENIPDYCFSTKRAYNRQNRPEPFTPNTQPARNMSAGCTRTPTMADAAVTRA